MRSVPLTLTDFSNASRRRVSILLQFACKENYTHDKKTDRNRPGTEFSTSRSLLATAESETQSGLEFNVFPR